MENVDASTNTVDLEHVCRYCLKEDEHLLFPCKCRTGVHPDELVKWIINRPQLSFTCEVCKSVYSVDKCIDYLHKNYDEGQILKLFVEMIMAFDDGEANNNPLVEYEPEPRRESPVSQRIRRLHNSRIYRLNYIIGFARTGTMIFLRLSIITIVLNYFFTHFTAAISPMWLHIVIFIYYYLKNGVFI